MILLSWLIGCGDEDPCASRRDLSASPAGLTLVEAEHPTGWGQADCYQCHQRWTIHAEDCLDGIAVQGDDIAAETIADCAACHGTNGVPGEAE
jgi:hypothetical protein